jgi:hypothetical protein
MPVEAVLTLLGAVAFIIVFLLSEGSMKAIAILVFVAGILFSTSGLAGGIKDVVTQIVTR